MDLIYFILNHYRISNIGSIKFKLILWIVDTIFEGGTLKAKK